MTTTARSIGHRTFSTNRHIWVALACLLIGTASVAACGPADDVVDPDGIAVSVPDSSATPVDAGTADAGNVADQPCTVDADCLSGSCITAYRDEDGDGFGGAKVTRCQGAPAAGHVLVGGDCCDSDPVTNPGVTTFSTIANACGGHDRNCDGKGERPDGSNDGRYPCGCIPGDGTVTTPFVCTYCR